MSRTKSPTSLLPLPVAPQDFVLERYLDSLVPLLSHEDYQKNQAKAKEFAESTGPLFHKLLLERKDFAVNWLEDWWFNMAYQAYRDTVMINVSPALVLEPRDSSAGPLNQAVEAATYLHRALEFKSLTEAGKLEPDLFRNAPSCMAQYQRMFATCRIPLPKRDSFASYWTEPKHISVVHRGIFYHFDVYHKDGTILSIQALAAQFQRILTAEANNKNRDDKARGIGALTALHRDDWANYHKTLRENPPNRLTLRTIETSILLVCLEDTSPSQHHQVLTGKEDIKDLENEWKEETRKKRLTEASLHGEGSFNRWYDKTLQLVVFANGTASVVFEHSVIDGRPVARLTDFLNEAIATPPIKPISSDVFNTLPSPQRLEWDISPHLAEGIQKAKEYAKKEASLTCSNTFLIKGDWRERCKKYGQSPDSVFQVCVQLAFYHIHKTFTATYETASTHQFSRGRTETIRSLTKEVKNFVLLAQQTNDASKLLPHLISALNKQRVITTQAGDGLGADRYLLGVRMLAAEHGIDVPELVKDDAFGKSSYFRLSTSQVSTKRKVATIFGPVVPNGYGLCYNLNPDFVMMNISCHRVDNMSPAVLGVHVAQALNFVEKIFLNAPPTRAKL